MAKQKRAQTAVRRGTNLFDLLVHGGRAIDPADAKIHLATINQANQDPLEVFFQGGFKDWQANQGKKNFRLPYIVSLIKLARNRWLFAGVFSTSGSPPAMQGDRYIYDTRAEPAGKGLIGRLIIAFERDGQMAYRLGTACAHSLLVDEVRPTKLTRADCDFIKRTADARQLPAFPGKILRTLVQYVLAQAGRPLERITYQELGRRLRQTTKNGDGWGRNLGKPLTVMGRALEQLSGEWRQQIPCIQGIVVQTVRGRPGLPSRGIRDFWPDYPKLTRAQKEDRVRFELANVEEFGTLWNEALRRLGLEPVKAGGAASSRRAWGSGGESPQHLALKEFVSDHPKVVGASKESEAIVEHVLPSLDTIDVFFRGRRECVAVEVKSSVSERVKDDYQRGIYQAIKYLALLKAMSQVRAQGICRNIRSVLVLENRVPAKMRALARLLSVEVRENVVPRKEYLRRAMAKIRRPS